MRSRIDGAARAAVVVTEFDRPAEAVWSLFSDPLALARWWGPPGMPMAVEHHDLRPGGRVEITVQTPAGEVRGRWTVHEVVPPHLLRFTFTSDGLDVTEITVEISDAGGSRTAMEVTAHFTSEEAMRHAVHIGFVEGLARSCATAHDVTGVM
ncbi:SRPBCC domain-containing protein [Euzebya sp.]|uniref:SRPBCC family protein n=1 Tax=Euzebya sp. TaxID=1971409 RepID=UPI003512CA0D